jgi:hypothetical protein
MRRDSKQVSDQQAARPKRSAVKDFFYGLTVYPFLHHTLQMKREAEALFLLAALGDLTGVPVMPPVYSLRLLPHVLPEIARWKRQLARRKDFWEKEEFDLHAV